MTHGPYERYEPDGQLGVNGTYNMGERCGEWLIAGVAARLDGNHYHYHYPWCSM